MPPDEFQTAACVAVPAALAVTNLDCVPVRFSPKVIVPLPVIGLPDTVNCVAVLLLMPTEVTEPPLAQALPEAKQIAPVPDTPLLRFEAERATPPT
jgi:hypothetical protein